MNTSPEFINCSCCKENVNPLYTATFEGERCCAPCYGALTVVNSRLSYFNKYKHFDLLATHSSVPKSEK